MHFTDFVTAVFALALTLGLIGLAAVGLRKYGPDAMARLSMQRKDRRMRVVETLVLDPTRRLVLVECDGTERLILLGDGRMVSEIGQAATQKAAR